MTHPVYPVCTTTHSYDLLSAECRHNPYPVLAQLRAEAPVYWSPQLQSWVLTRYDDIVAALHMPALSASRFGEPPAGVPEPVREKMARIFHFLSQWLVALDPPQHTRLRSLLNKAFTHGQVKRLEPRIRRIAHDLIDVVAPHGQMDVFTDYAYPLPVQVIAEILGVPLADRARLRRWSRCIVRFGGRGGVQAVAAMHQTVQEMTAYFQALIRRRRQHPGNDFISGLVTGNCLTSPKMEKQLMANFAFLLFVGHETTANAILSGVFAGLRQGYPDNLAVEEVLRFDTAVPHVVRLATEDLELGGQHIQAGQTVTLFLAAANRDPTHFENPDVFDGQRKDNRHLSFGHGVHYCLGAPLARLEVAIALRTLFTRLPSLQWAEEFQTKYGKDILYRGTSLPVVF